MEFKVSRPYQYVLNGNMCKTQKLSLTVVLLLLFTFSDAHLDRETFRSLVPFRECLGQKFPGLCFKERALDALNASIMSDRPLVLLDTVEIARNPEYHYNLSEENLPVEVSARSSKLSDLLYSKIEEFFKSRVVKFNMAPAFDEGRGKKDKGKGGMYIMMLGGMAAMMGQMFMGKIAFMAGTALVLAKIALFMSAIVGLKKLVGSGGGGKETAHVVYASSDGHSHGGGGWHRSLNHDAQNLAYKAHITEANNAGY